MSHYVDMEAFRKTAQLGDLAIDDQAQIAIDAAEEAIEDWCSRRFWTEEVDQTRYFSGMWNYVYVDDLTAITTLRTDDDGNGSFEVTWAASDYVLAPYNAAADGRPYVKLERSPLGTRRFPTHARSIEITGRFGWPAVPDRVTQATTLQGLRWLKRVRSSPLGVEAIVIEGSPVRIRQQIDPDVQVLLAPLRRMGP